MARQKLPREYFLQRIKDYYKKFKRAPRSNEFNGPFHKNVIKHFGSWEKAVKEATGVQLDYVRMTDEELLEPIRDFYAKNNNRLPAFEKIPRKTILERRFGDYKGAVKAALGIDIERALLAVLNTLCSNGVECASIVEIKTGLQLLKLNLESHQVRAHLMRCERNGFVKVQHGDRIALYSLTPEGKKHVK